MLSVSDERTYIRTFGQKKFNFQHILVLPIYLTSYNFFAEYAKCWFKYLKMLLFGPLLAPKENENLNLKFLMVAYVSIEKEFDNISIRNWFPFHSGLYFVFYSLTFMPIFIYVTLFSLYVALFAARFCVLV